MKNGSLNSKSEHIFTALLNDCHYFPFQPMAPKQKEKTIVTKPSEKVSKLKRPKTKEQKFKCEFCPKSYSLVRWNTLHGNRDHPDLVKSKWVPCEPCNTFFPTQSSLANHNSHFHQGKNFVPMVTNTIQCPHCAKSCYNQRKLLTLTIDINLKFS